MRRRRELLAGPVLLAVVLGLAGCGRSPSAPEPSAAGVDPVTLARQAFDRDDCAAAAPMFRTLAGREPENLEFHFKLGMCTSHLSLIDETVREFQWVLAHAPDGSAEAETAQEWLTKAGHLSSATASASDSSSGADERGGDSGVSGMVTWAEPGAEPQPSQRMQVHLIALPGQEIAEQRFTVRTDQDGRYSFKRIPAGSYKVTSSVGGTPQWRLQVKLEPGRETTLDLNSGNSVSVRDDFPASAPPAPRSS